MMNIVGVLTVCLVGLSLAQEDPGPIVEIDNGLIQGRVIETHYEDSATRSQFVNSFYGIPFGLPPVGDLRFEVNKNNLLHPIFSF